MTNPVESTTNSDEYFSPVEDSKWKSAMAKENHYKFIEKYGRVFSSVLGQKNVVNVADNLSGDGDKCYQYEDAWYAAGIPFPIGVMIYLLSKEHPYCKGVRSTDNGWFPPEAWVVDVYKKQHALECERREKTIYKAIVAVRNSYIVDVLNKTPA